MKHLALLAATAVLLGVAPSAHAGGELPTQPIKGMATPQWAPPSSPSFPPSTGNKLAKSKIGPPLGTMVPRNAPLPPPQRYVGWGYNCYDFYGPTYYHPFKHNVYEGLNPTYYPFYQPRLWPNYKTPGVYEQPTNGGSGRSLGYWDDYDDWTRAARYGEKQ